MHPAFNTGLREALALPPVQTMAATLADCECLFGILCESTYSSFLGLQQSSLARDLFSHEEFSSILRVFLYTSLFLVIVEKRRSSSSAHKVAAML